VQCGWTREKWLKDQKGQRNKNRSEILWGRRSSGVTTRGKEKKGREVAAGGTGSSLKGKAKRKGKEEMNSVRE